MLDEFWSRTFGSTLPVAYRMRDLFRDRWVRFHSLPDSKRYAETDAEWSTLLERHNTVLSRLANEGTCLQLLTSCWTGAALPDGPAAEVCELPWPAEHWRTVALHELDEDPEPNYLHVFHSAVEWTSGVLDDVFRLTADDRIANVMIIDATDCWLLHPYDGGMDVIARSPEQRDTMSRELKLWRSRRADGL